MCVTRGQLNGLAVAGDSLFQTAQFFKGGTEIVVGLGKLGRQFDGFAKADDRFGQLPSFFKGCPQIAVRLGKAGGHSNCLAKAENDGIQPSGTMMRHGRCEERLDGLRGILLHGTVLLYFRPALLTVHRSSYEVGWVSEALPILH